MDAGTQDFFRILLVFAVGLGVYQAMIDREPKP